MKKRVIIILIIYMCIHGFAGAYNVTVTGTVKNNSGLPIPNHLVYAQTDTTCSYIYSNSIFTDSIGSYSFTIFGVPLPIQSCALILSTYDCNSILNDTTIIFTPSNNFFNVGFYICDSSSFNACQAFFIHYPDTMQLFKYFFIDMSFVSFGTITSWLWDFGDSTTSSLQNPVHTYSSPGQYPVCLTISGSMASGCQSSTYDTIYVDTIYHQLCKANFTFSLDTTINTPNYYHFYDSSTTYLGSYLTWFWDFGDGTISTLQNPDHQFFNQGTYNVCLYVYSINGGMINCVDSICKTITITLANKYNLGGQIFAGNYPIDYGTAYLYYATNNYIIPVGSAQIDTLGYYYFYMINASRYIIKVELDSSALLHGQYFPTYHGDNLLWGNSQIITLDTNIWIAGVNLISVPGYNSGQGTIIGNVVHGNNKLMDHGTPVPFTEVLIMDMNSDPLDFTKTDALGNFSFNDIEYGSYLLYAEATGKYTFPVLVNVSYTFPVPDTVFLKINDDETIGITENISEDLTIEKVYPNPVADNLYVKLNVTHPASFHFFIMNILGENVFEKILFLKKGKNTIQLPVSFLPDGIYILATKSAGLTNTVSVKFIK